MYVCDLNKISQTAKFIHRSIGFMLFSKVGTQNTKEIYKNNNIHKQCKQSLTQALNIIMLIGMGIFTKKNRIGA